MRMILCARGTAPCRPVGFVFMTVRFFLGVFPGHSVHTDLCVFMSVAVTESVRISHRLSATAVR